MWIEIDPVPFFDRIDPEQQEPEKWALFVHIRSLAFQIDFGMTVEEHDTQEPEWIPESRVYRACFETRDESIVERVTYNHALDLDPQFGEAKWKKWWDYRERERWLGHYPMPQWYRELAELAPFVEIHRESPDPKLVDVDSDGETYRFFVGPDFSEKDLPMGVDVDCVVVRYLVLEMPEVNE